MKRLVPDARKLLGASAFAMLERGAKIEVDALVSMFREPLLKELRRRLQRLGRTG